MRTQQSLTDWWDAAKRTSLHKWGISKEKRWRDGYMERLRTGASRLEEDAQEIHQNKAEHPQRPTARCTMTHLAKREDFEISNRELFKIGFLIETLEAKEVLHEKVLGITGH